MAEAKDLFRAVRRGDTGGVKAILAINPELVHAHEDEGRTPLHLASWKGFPAIVQALLDAGADVNAVDTNGHYGGTPLHAAAHGNQAETARILVERGADLEAVSVNGRTPIEETGIHKATAVARLLLENGARR